MKKAGRIHRKLSDVHVIWFGESNQWIGLEKPAFKVYKLHSKSYPKKKIGRKISKKYGLGKSESKKFVQEIISGLKTASSPKNSTRTSKEHRFNISKSPAEAFSVRTYIINKVSFQFHFGSKLLEYYFHAPMECFESHERKDPLYIVNIFEKGDHFFLEIMNDSHRWKCDSIPQLKQRLNLAILNIIYAKKPSYWFSRLHASAVTDEKQAVLLCSESGGGKSTLATLLQTKGLRVISDDVVPMGGKNLAYPTPAALSVKKGSFDMVRSYFPNFDPGLISRYEHRNNDICFFPFQDHAENNFKAVPAKIILFVKYNPTIDLTFRPLQTIDALKLIHQESWVAASYKQALQFIKWIENLTCYTLEYSDTEKALVLIRSLLINDESTDK